MAMRHFQFLQSFFIPPKVGIFPKGVVIDSKHKERISAAIYSIEDKNRVDHLDKYAADKYRRDSRRDKMGSGMEFPELKDYKPNIQVTTSQSLV